MSFNSKVHNAMYHPQKKLKNKSNTVVSYQIKQFTVLQIYVRRYHKHGKKALLALLAELYIPAVMASCKVNCL